MVKLSSKCNSTPVSGVIHPADLFSRLLRLDVLVAAIRHLRQLHQIRGVLGFSPTPAVGAVGCHFVIHGDCVVCIVLGHHPAVVAVRDRVCG